MMKLVGRWFAVALMAALLSGCGAGKQFTMPADGSLKLGETTPAEAVAMIGEPVTKSSERLTSVETTAGVISVFSPVPQQGTYEAYNYVFIDTTGPVLAGPFAGAAPRRTLKLVFWNGKLVGYGAMSNFKDDTTNFDDTRVAQIKRGESTETDVKALLGKPSGATVFPLLATPDGHSLIYSYSEDDISAHERHAKFLAVYVDHNGIVRDMHSNDTVTPLPVQTAPAPVPVFVPIITPKGK